MALTLEMSPEMEEELCATAARAGVAPTRYVVDLIKEELGRNRRSFGLSERTESGLLLAINEGLPETIWGRYRDLEGKGDAEALTPEEHQELIALINQIETWNVRRLELVAELGRLRGTSLDETMRQLGVGPRSDA
jgi:hypothetical protein